MAPEAQQPLNVAKSYAKLLCVAKKCLPLWRLELTSLQLVKYEREEDRPD